MNVVDSIREIEREIADLNRRLSGARQGASESHTVEKSPTGFPNQTDSVLSFVAGTRTFTIAPTGVSFRIYHIGHHHDILAADDIIIPDSDGLHVIYYDEAVLSQMLNPTHAQMEELIVDQVLVALIYWNLTDNAAYVLADERHGCVMSGRTHEWIHYSIGASYQGGFGISGYTLLSALDASLTFEIVNGSFRDEDLGIDIIDGNPAVKYEQQLNGGDASLPVLYRDDVTGAWTEQAANTLPYISAVGGNQRLAYQNDDGDGTWSQVEVSNNKYTLHSIVATNDWQYPIKMVQGAASYNNIADALDGVSVEFGNWGDFPSAELILMYVFILQTSNGYGGAKKARIIDVIDFRFSRVTGASAVSQEHGSLSGLDHLEDHAGYIRLAAALGTQ